MKKRNKQIQELKTQIDTLHFQNVNSVREIKRILLSAGNEITLKYDHANN